MNSGRQSGFNEFVRCRDYKQPVATSVRLVVVTTLTEDSAIAAAAKAGGKEASKW